MSIASISVRGTELSASDTREQYRVKIARITLDSMVQFVGLLDAEGTVLEINQVALDAVGIKLSDVEGKPFWTTFWWQVSEEINATLRESIRRASRGEFVRWDTPIYGRAGGAETIIIDASLMPVKDEHGNVVFIAAEGRDITEKKAYEREIARQREELAQLDKLKTQFFANISHEFRTPLTLMMGPLESALADADGLSPANRERLELAHRNALRQLKLVNTLLDFSRIEAGRIEAVYEPVELAALTAELASVFRSAVERAGMKFVIDCPPLTEAVYVDREMWEKIVLNLVSNAFKFTFDGGIIVSLKQTERAVELSVADTGTGIPEEELPRLFERFHRVKGARGRSYEGSGIGLALVQELVRLHGGGVRVRSEVDRGSEFTATIPLGHSHLPADHLETTRTLASTGVRASAFSEEALRWLPETAAGGFQISERPESSTVPEQGQGADDHPPARILLVDDNADMREYLQRLLGENYEVCAVADGEAALTAVSNQSFDLVLTDVMMPRLDGFGLLKALREDERTRSLPVILLSARAGEESRVEGLEAGADDYLIKPFSARELLARVEAHLKLRRARLKAESRNRFLVRLDDEIRPLNDPTKITLTAARILGEHLGVDRCAYADIESDEDTMNLMGNYLRNAEIKSIVGQLRFADFGAEVLQLMREDKPYVVNDIDAHAPPVADRAAYRGTQIQAVICVPLHKGGRFVAAMAVHTTTPRIWSKDEVELVRYVAARCWESIERARVARVLNESEERFRAFVTASSDVVYRMSPDWSEMRQLHGREFIADADEPRREWLEIYIHPDDRPRVMAVIEEAIRTRSKFELEHRVLRVDGSIGWTFSRAIPILGENGEILEWFGAASDVTWRKEAEQTLRNSEEKYRTVLGSMDEGSMIAQMIFDAKGETATDYLILETNEAFHKHTGLPLDIVGKTIREIMPGDEIPWLGACGEVALTGQSRRFEDETRLEPLVGWYDVFIQRIGEPERRRISMMLREITERARAEEALREADRRKDQFLAMLAHELRNPLAPIRNAAQALKLIGPADANHQWAREVIERQTQQLTRLVDDLLDVSRITSGKVILQKAPLELAAIIHRAVETSRPMIDARRHEFTLSLPAESLRVEGDLTRLVQVVSNLLNNAAKFTDEGGRICLTLEREGEEAVISVRDDGMGISPEMLPHIFELFSQADQSLDRSQGGLGIGLTLVRSLVDLHGGRVEARSAEGRRGSEFVVRLPLIDVLKLETESAETPLESKNAERRNHWRVLVVEDNIDSAELAAFILRLDGHEVRMAHDGLKALDLAHSFQPQIVLCDIGLPGMNGYELARRLRGQSEFKQTKLIALSGYGQDDARRRAKEAGFDYHLVKPVDPDSLKTLLSSLHSEEPHEAGDQERPNRSA